MLEFLQGKKTFIVAILMVITAGLYSQGFITDELFKTIEGLLGAGGLAALRAGVAKS